VTHDESKSIGELLARVVVRELPKIATIERNVSKRGGRVYIDYLQNGHGKLLVAPYTARPRPGATVSTPLRWTEVKKGLNPEKFTIKSVPKRARSLKGGDPMAPLLELGPDLVGALEKLAERMG
jgi:bifunctional non-homologous end joining protein LigD